MSNYPNMKIHSCSENVTNVEYIDIDFSTALRWENEGRNK